MHDHNYMEFNSPQEMHNEELSNDLYYDSSDHIEIDIAKEHEEDIVNEIFYRNLAENFKEGELDYIGVELSEHIREDESARESKDERYAKILKRLGFADNARIGGADFPGASQVTHPIITEGCIDFASRAIKELLPPNGPVKTKILGKQTVEKLERAERKRKFMNWNFADKLNYRVTLEKMLTQLALAGSQFLKLWWDKSRSQLQIDYVPLDHIYFPYHCEDFLTAERVTQIIKLDKGQFRRKCKDGFYIAHNESGIFETISEEAQTLPDSVSNAIEGKDSITNTEQNEVTVLYEVHTYLELDFDEMTKGELAPYIITVSKATNEVLAIYRNWEEGDESMIKLDWFVQFNYITWRGSLGIGFAEILDGVAAATTGSLRALLDSAHSANFPTLIGTKGTKIEGQNTNVAPGQITQVSGPNGMTSKLSDQLMPLQLGQPQPILLQLMQYLDAKVQEFYNTTSSALENVGDETPVGTTLALIEEGSKRYAAIHARLLDSEKRVFTIANRIFRHNLDTEVIVEELGELMISRFDFEFDDIELVADPHIYSEAQRFALNQAILQLAQSAPQLYNMVEIHRRILQSMNVQDIDRLFALPQQAGKLNAVAENKAVLDGTPLQAFTEQNHFAHLTTHLGFALNPMFGSNPFNMSKMIQLLNHIQEHVALLYGQVFNEALVQSGGAEHFSIMEDESIPQIDTALSDLQPQVLERVNKMLEPFMGPYQEWMQKVQQANQPPQDPNVMKAKADEQRVQLQAQEMQQKAQQSQADNEIAKMKIEADQNYNNTMLSLEQMKTNTEENRNILNAYMELEKMKLQQGMHIDEKMLEDHIHRTKADFERDNATADKALKAFELHQRDRHHAAQMEAQQAAAAQQQPPAQ